VQGLLEVRRGNVAALELYRKLGFVVVGVRPHYYRDNQEDALLMTLPRIDPVTLQSFL
jgi:[ribosomal protein S18]-alanine N-acetyltransferase